MLRLRRGSGPYHGPVRSWRDVDDLFSIARPGVAALSFVVAVIGAWWPGLPAWTVLVLVVAGVALLVWSWWPRRRAVSPPPAAGVAAVRVLAANCWYKNRRMRGFAASIVSHVPDVVVVSELSYEVHDVLSGAFEHHEVLTIGGPRGHGVYSHFPLERLPDPAGPGEVLHVRVHGPFRFQLLAAHMPRAVVFASPSLGTARLDTCRDGIAELAELARREPHTVVAGDLNLTDRQIAYRWLTSGRLDAMRTGRPRTTFPGWPWYPVLAMRIDHVVVPADWSVQGARVVKVRGSDHRGVIAELRRPPE